MKHKPFPIRFNDEDLQIIKELQEETGLTTPSVVRLALRALKRERSKTKKNTRNDA